MKTVTAYFKIVTPMFLGGADSQATRLRAESLKSQIVFWWRALNYGGMVEKQNDDQPEKEKQALIELQKMEKRLFGDSANKGSGQSGVLMSFPAGVDGLTSLQKDKVLNAKGTEVDDQKLSNGGRQRQDVVGDGARYFGYGLMQAFTTYKKRNRQKVSDGNGGFLFEREAGAIDRSCFASEQHFMVRFQFSPRLTQEEVDSFVKALKLFGFVGGMGARVRRGWGSVALLSLKWKDLDKTNKCEDWAAPVSREAYITTLQELVGTFSGSGENYPLTAFAAESQIHITNYTGNDAPSDPLAVLDKMAQGMQRYRSWGRNGKVNGKESEKNFKTDHDWYHEYKNGKQASTAPKRIAFGLPQNYNKNFGVSASGDSDRRASPLFFHVHQIGNQSFGVILLLPTLFLPTDTVSVGNQTPNYTFDVSVLTDFLKGKPDPDNRGSYIELEQLI